MKRIPIILFTLTLLYQIVYAQLSNEGLVKSIYLEDLSSEGVYLHNNNRNDFLITLFNISNDYEFRNQIIKGTKDQIREYDDLGYVHERYEQYYQGIKIEHSVKVQAKEWIKICPNFVAQAGSNVIISIDPPAAAPSPTYLSSPKVSTTNYEILLENPSLRNLATNNPDIEFHNHSFTLYPNPNNGKFQIDANFPLTDIANFKVVSLLGVTIYETQNLTSSSIQLSSHVSGTVFVITILKNGTLLTHKMFIHK